MLTILRKNQKGVLIIITVVIIVAFAFWGNFSGGGAGTPASRDYLSVYGKRYKYQDVNRLARTFNLSQQLGYNPRMPRSSSAPARMANFLFGERRLDDDLTDYVFRLIVLRHEAKRLGIHPSDAAIMEAIEALPIFQGTDGKFDSSRYNMFIQNAITPQGFTVQTLFDIVGDSLAFQKLFELVGSNIHSAHSEIDREFKDEFETITACLVRLEAEEAEVSEDEIKEYYEKNKDKFQTSEKRAVSYVLFPLEEPEDDKETDPAASSKGGAEEKTGASPEDPAKEKTDASPEDPAKEKTGASPEDPAKEKTGASPEDPAKEKTGAETEEDREAGEKKRRERLNRLAREIEEFTVAAEAEGADFDKLAEAKGHKLTRTPLFERTDPPEELKEERDLLDAVFAQSPNDPVSNPPITTSKGSYVFKVTEVMAASPLPLEKVRDDIAETLKDEKSEEALNKRAEELREKLTAALDAGKSFTASAEAEGLKVEAPAPFSRLTLPQVDPSLQYALLRASRNLRAGEISEPIRTPQGRVLLYTAKRELLAVPEAANRRKAVARQLEGMERYALFHAWFDEAVKKANPYSLVPTRKTTPETPQPEKGRKQDA